MCLGDVSVVRWKTEQKATNILDNCRSEIHRHDGVATFTAAISVWAGDVAHCGQACCVGIEDKK